MKPLSVGIAFVGTAALLLAGCGDDSSKTYVIPLYDTPPPGFTPAPTIEVIVAPTFTRTPRIPTITRTPTSTATARVAPTQTHTPSPVPTSTFTLAATRTATPTGTATLTATRTRTSTPTDTPAVTATHSASATPADTGTATATMIISTSTPTLTPTATLGDTATATATMTAIVSTSTPTTTVAETATPSLTPTALLATPTPTLTATTAGETATPSATPTPTDTPQTGPSDTPMETRTSTPTPTATATPVCGDGFLGANETCAFCPADCVVQPCTATTPMQQFRVDFTTPRTATAVTVLIGYRSNLVSIPGAADATSVRQRVKNTASNSTVAVNDLDYALRVVVGRGVGVPVGRLFTIDFDSCQSAAAPTAADFGCTMEGCAGGSGPIRGCTCTVTTP